MTEPRDYYSHFLGRGLERELLCPRCGADGPNREASMVWLCETCFTNREDDGRDLGDWGVPGYAIRESGLRLAVTLAAMPAGFPACEKIVPLPAIAGSRWLALTAAQDLLEVDFASGTMRRICGLTGDQVLRQPEPESFLIASPWGDFAMAAPPRSSRATVVDLASGTAIREVHMTQSGSFSAAFIRQHDRTLFICATDWNRLDVLDLRSGELLTARTLPAYEGGSTLPPKYLDYFHRNLEVSPNQEWIADDGWVWGGFGVMRTWNLRRWLAENVWESEDGPSVRKDIWREGIGSAPCWVGPHRLAAWGVGDVQLLPAIRIVDVADGAESPPLIGPLGPTQPAQTPEAAQHNRALGRDPTLAYDDYLFAWSPAAGLSAWDLADGARVFAAPELCPLAYHRGTKEFLSRDSAGGYHLSKLVSA